MSTQLIEHEWTTQAGYLARFRFTGKVCYGFVGISQTHALWGMKPENTILPELEPHWRRLWLDLCSVVDFDFFPTGQTPPAPSLSFYLAVSEQLD